MSRARMATPRVAAIERWRTMRRAQAVQARLACCSWRSRGQSTRGPMPPSRAGRRVRLTATETTGMSMPPMPTLRRPGTGSTTRAIRPMPTVRPLSAITRPAVAIAMVTAVWLSAPLARSSRQRVTSSSE